MNSGGIRGIVQVATLRKIEAELGGEPPIQYFFDLVVGTRYALLSVRVPMYSPKGVSPPRCRWCLKLTNMFTAREASTP